MQEYKIQNESIFQYYSIGVKLFALPDKLL